MEQNKTYIIRVNVDERMFTYTAKIIFEDDDFITFIDKYDKEWTYNKSRIISFEEVKE